MQNHQDIKQDKWYCALKLSLSGPSDVLLKSTCTNFTNREGHHKEQVTKVYNSFETCLQNCNLDEALSNYLTSLLFACYTTDIKNISKTTNDQKTRLEWLLKWKVLSAFQIDKTLQTMKTNAIEAQCFLYAQWCFWYDLQTIFASRLQRVQKFQDYKEELIRLIVERTLHDLEDILNRNPSLFS